MKPLETAEVNVFITFIRNLNKTWQLHKKKRFYGSCLTDTYYLIQDVAVIRTTCAFCSKNRCFSCWDSSRWVSQHQGFIWCSDLFNQESQYAPEVNMTYVKMTQQTGSSVSSSAQSSQSVWKFVRVWLHHLFKHQLQCGKHTSLPQPNRKYKKEEKDSGTSINGL